MDIKYEWDEAKSRSNIERGRVGFEAILRIRVGNRRTVTRSDRQGEVSMDRLPAISAAVFYRVVYTVAERPNTDHQLESR